MFGLPEIEVSRRHERLLLKTTVDENGPGTILRDFEAFLAFVEEGELPLTGTHQLRRQVLADLNARLAHPLQTGLTRPLQKSYPHVNGLYLLLRASGLTFVQGTDRKPLLAVDEVVRQVWDSLNPTERYCTLLETWLVRGHPEIIGERGRGWFRVPDTFHQVQWFFQQIPQKGLQIAGNKDAEDSLRYWPGLHNLALLELFGLVEVRHGPPEQGKGWSIETVERTSWGDALLAALHAGFFGDVDNLLALESEEKVPFGVLQQALVARSQRKGAPGHVVGRQVAAVEPTDVEAAVLIRWPDRVVQPGFDRKSYWLGVQAFERAVDVDAALGMPPIHQAAVLVHPCGIGFAMPWMIVAIDDHVVGGGHEDRAVVATPRQTLVDYAAGDLRPGPDGRLRFSFCASTAVAAWSEMTLDPPPAACRPPRRPRRSSSPGGRSRRTSGRTRGPAPSPGPAGPRA